MTTDTTSAWSTPANTMPCQTGKLRHKASPMTPSAISGSSQRAEVGEGHNQTIEQHFLEGLPALAAAKPVFQAGPPVAKSTTAHRPASAARRLPIWPAE
jgi:hypothetical protein